MAAPDVLLVGGNGFNCERETEHAFRLCGSNPKIVHMNDLIARMVSLSQFQIIAFIGGFSYGDHLGGGKVAANKFRYYLIDALNEFIHQDTLIIGICNGFQVITQLGLLPGFDNDYTKHLITLANNSSSRYEDRWVLLKANTPSPCIFIKNIDYLFLPVRHGEGKVLSKDKNIIERLCQAHQDVLFYCNPYTKQPTQEYPYNPNGSPNGIAGICDPTGRVFGLMPHPEAFLSIYNHPYWTRLKIHGKLPQEGDGVTIFRNAVTYFT
jgi:phosphoribosylformylglycinamidine synthase